MQGTSDLPGADLGEAARRELDGLICTLQASGARVFVLEDPPEPPKPDAVFPNNWVSFHADGSAVLYPLLSPLRRAEVRREHLEELIRRHGVGIERVIDLTHLADEGVFLEGTGSLVLDRPRGLAFACRSARTSPEGLEAFEAASGYEVLAFDALDEQGLPYYHTNVLMCVGDRFALVALEALPDPRERERVRAACAEDGRTVVELTRAQVRAFAGNVLEVERTGGGSLLALSTRAFEALSGAARRVLSEHVQLVPVPFDTIESVGGGGVRCAVAAIHCPLP